MRAEPASLGAESPATNYAIFYAIFLYTSKVPFFVFKPIDGAGVGGKSSETGQTRVSSAVGCPLWR